MFYMLNFAKARFLVDEFIKENSEYIDDEVITEGIKGLDQYWSDLEIEDNDKRLEVTIAGIVSAYAYIEALIKEEKKRVSNGEA